MKKAILIISLVWVVLSIHAQEKDQWSKGEVLLTSGERIDGLLVYFSDAEILSVKLKNGTQKTYGSSQIYSFHFLDSRQLLIRNFKKSVLPKSSREAIVEVVFDGELQVQRCFKPKYLSHGRRPLYINFFPSIPQSHNRFEYFVHDGISLCTLEYFLRKKFDSKTKRWNKQLNMYRYQNLFDNGTGSWLLVLIHYNILENDFKSKQNLPKTQDSTRLMTSTFF